MYLAFERSKYTVQSKAIRIENIETFSMNREFNDTFITVLQD